MRVRLDLHTLGPHKAKDIWAHPRPQTVTGCQSHVLLFWHSPCESPLLSRGFGWRQLGHANTRLQMSVLHEKTVEPDVGWIRSKIWKLYTPVFPPMVLGDGGEGP